MQVSTEEGTTTNSPRTTTHIEDLHGQAKQYISSLNQLIFQNLPAVIAQIIEQEVWKTRQIDYKHFGEYALNQSSEGLGITNNEMLGLLRSAMEINTQHRSHWGDVLEEVDTTVRTYAKEHKIPLKELNKSLSDRNELSESTEEFCEPRLTYLPSRSKSIDGQLIKLKTSDPQAYDKVIQGKIKLKEAWQPPAPRIKLLPIESVKNKFSSLSKADRDAFLAWLEEKKGEID